MLDLLDLLAVVVDDNGRGGGEELLGAGELLDVDLVGLGRVEELLGVPGWGGLSVFGWTRWRG